MWMFLFAGVVSFIGSFQLGPVNVAVIDATIRKSRKNGLAVATGGVLPEFLYSAIAVYFVATISEDHFVIQYLSWVIVPVFLVMGVITIFRKPAGGEEIADRASHYKGLLKGFVLALLNPQLAVFWAGIIVLLRAHTFDPILPAGVYEATGLTGFSDRIGFIAGAAIGAFFLQCTFCQLAFKFKKKILKVIKTRFNLVVGLVYIGIAVLEIIKQIVT